MNPQPDPSVGNIVAIIFCISVVYYTIIAIRENKTFSVNDNFIIGYLERDPIIILPPPSSPPPDRFKDPDNKPPQPINPTPKSNKAKSTKDINSKLYTDCMDALVALGMRKREARERTKSIFLTMNTPPSSIQAFLMIALQKS